MGNAIGQCVDVAVRAVAMAELAGEPVLGDATIVTAQKLEDAADQARMLVATDIAVVGYLADIPQKRDLGAPGGQAGDFRIARERIERHHVGSSLRSRQSLDAREMA